MGSQIDNLTKTLALSTSTNEAINILIVDDDDIILQLMVDILTSKNYLVDTASSAEVAIEKISQANYSLILVDINLPGMNGNELLLYCKKNTPNSAVIIITGAPDIDAAVNLMKEGALDYLSKPIEVTTLLERIKNALKKRATIKIDPELAPILGNIPAEYSITKIICSTETSLILLVEREGKYFAMKVLKYDTLDEYSINKIQRFFREAQLMRSISHPNIVKVYEYKFEDNKVPFILTEYVPSSSLTKEFILKMNFQEKLSFIHQIASALWEIHKRGIIHRDIKPSNIMVTNDGNPKLTDFGIAGIKDSSLTMTREILGSPRYMSPEAFVSCRDTDARSDIFSFGLVAYEILTGKKAFSGNNINQIIHATCTEKPIRPSKLNSEISTNLDNILAKMLEKAPQDRYKNNAVIAMDIEAIMNKTDKKKKQANFFAKMFGNSKKSSSFNVWAN